MAVKEEEDSFIIINFMEHYTYKPNLKYHIPILQKM